MEDLPIDPPPPPRALRKFLCISYLAKHRSFLDKRPSSAIRISDTSSNSTTVSTNFDDLVARARSKSTVPSQSESTINKPASETLRGILVKAGKERLASGLEGLAGSRRYQSHEIFKKEGVIEGRSRTRTNSGVRFHVCNSG